MQHVFIIGSKGIPANYGGYETFVEKLIRESGIADIKYHVACAVDSAEEVGEFEHNGAHCFKVLRRPVGAARAIFYDIDALKWCTAYIENNRVEHPIVYVLACRIGPFFGKYVKRIHALGGKVFVNPDGPRVEARQVERARPQVLESLGARDGQARRPYGVRLQEHREVHSRGVCRPAPRDDLHRLRGRHQALSARGRRPQVHWMALREGPSPSATTWSWDASCPRTTTRP